eukprot:COSAG02_NODE_8006_length_2749_cov_1.439623_1_plen_130_part_00
MLVATEARVAVVAEEACVRLTADLVRATASVVGGGSPCATVEGAELVAGEGGGASAWRWRLRLLEVTGWAGDISTAADSRRCVGVSNALSRADAVVRCASSCALVTAGVSEWKCGCERVRARARACTFK